MKKLIMAIMLTYIAAIVPAYAQMQNTHAIGDLYTKSLNMIESAGMLDNLAPKQYAPVTDMHINQGQVFMTIQQDNGPEVIIYDLLSYKLIIPATNTAQ